MSLSATEPLDRSSAVPGDVEALARTLAAAFAADPVFNWLVPEKRREARLRRFFTFELREVVLPVGCVWTAPDRSGAVLCVPPRKWHVPTRLLIRHGRTFLGVFGARLPRASALLAEMERHHLREEHLYLPYIGVTPEVQGLGRGTQLIARALERCDEERLPAYLEGTSERNVALYQRLGFVIERELSFAGSPPLWLMIRAPR